MNPGEKIFIRILICIIIISTIGLFIGVHRFKSQMTIASKTIPQTKSSEQENILLEKFRSKYRAEYYIRACSNFFEDSESTYDPCESLLDLQIVQKEVEETKKEDPQLLTLLRQTFEKAYSEAKKAADADNALGFFALGDIYYNGRGIEKDEKKAFDYFSKALNHKEPIYCARVALGNMYYEGRVVPQDTTKARELWENDVCKGSFLDYSIQAYNHSKELAIAQKDTKTIAKEASNCFEDEFCSHLSYYEEYDNTWFRKCEQGKKWMDAGVALGDADSQYVAGLWYTNDVNLGCCLPYDCDAGKGLELFVSSAKQGNTDAMFLAGHAYLEGKPYGEQDSKKAEYWLLKAGNRKDGGSANELAKMYYFGLGVKPDYEKAKHWANQAIKNGFPSARYYLGLMYYEGKGVKQDYKKAADLFKQCTDYYSEDLDAQYLLEKMHFYGQVPNPNPGKIERDPKEMDYRPWDLISPLETYQELSLNRLWINAAIYNDAQAQFLLGEKYEKGIDVQKDIARAVEWYSRAAQQEHPEALYKMVVFHIEGPSGKEEYSCWVDILPEKFPLLEKAAQLGSIDAQTSLGKAYYTGLYYNNNCLGRGWRYRRLFLARDFEKAFFWLSKAAGKDQPTALYYLGKMYLHGRYVKKDEKHGEKLMERAKEKGFDPYQDGDPFSEILLP